MKHIKKIIYLPIALFFIVGISSCSHELDQREDCGTAFKAANNTELLIEYLERKGDPVNCKFTCTVNAKDVHTQLGFNQYILDLRSKNTYDKSHIPGAVHMPMNRLYFHMKKTVRPMKYDRIVLVCNTGQSATYATSLMRILGFPNVYAMEWGMSSWNRSLAKNWTDRNDEKIVLSRNGEALDLTFYDLPNIETDFAWRGDILNERVEHLLAKGFKKISIKSSELKEPKDAQIIAYTENQLYKNGHYPGSIHFEVKKSLRRNDGLLSINPEKKTYVYSENGFESAYAVAYLQLLGYDAKTVKYGMNSFGIRTANTFSKSELNDYILVDVHGNVVFEEKKVNVISTDSKPTEKKVVVPQKVEEEEEGC